MTNLQLQLGGERLAPICAVTAQISRGNGVHQVRSKFPPGGNFAGQKERVKFLTVRNLTLPICHFGLQIGREFNLTVCKFRFTNDPVTPEEEIEAMLKTVREQTLERGSKSALAKFLGVSRQRLQNWLHGAIPSGTTLLRLKEWADQQAKQKTPARVRSTRKGAAPKRKYENQSEPQRGS